MSDFSGHVVSIRNRMGEEASMFTAQKHISEANQCVIKNWVQNSGNFRLGPRSLWKTPWNPSLQCLKTGGEKA